MVAAFQSSHGGLARSHLFGNLLLTQACVDAGFDQFAGKLKFWFEGCAFLEKLRIFIPTFSGGLRKEWSRREFFESSQCDLKGVFWRVLGFLPEDMQDDHSSPRLSHIATAFPTYLIFDIMNRKNSDPCYRTSCSGQPGQLRTA